MPSTGAGGKPSRSTSAIVAATASGYHLLKIDGYSRTKGVPTGEKLTSSPFTVGGHRWRIDYYPNGQNSEVADYISIALMLDENVTTGVKAQYDFCFADEVLEQAPSLAWASVDNFPSYSGWWYTKFMKRRDLEKSKHLRKDSITIRCDIVVIKDYRAEDTTFVSVPPCDLHQHLGDLLETERGADVVFEVGSKAFAAHRCVLAARSPVFSVELFGSMEEGNTTGGVVHIQDMEAQVFKALLHFAYTESLLETRKEDENVMCQHLLVAADRYGMERLKLICEEKLCEYIDVDTVATILTLAEQHRCDGLKKACFHFLSSSANLKAVLATDDFQHLSRSCPSVTLELVAMSTGP